MTNHRITTNAKEVVKNKIERMRATFHYTPKESFWEYRGNKLTQRQFDLTLPIAPKAWKTAI